MSFLDGVTADEEKTVALAKPLASCLVVRGAQLSVVKRLDSRFVFDVHASLISWVCKRIASYEATVKKKARNKAILFFKVLTPLLGSVEARDSLRM